MLLNRPEFKKNMEKCSQCNRHASLPFYVMLNGKLIVLCFACACNSAGLATIKTNASRAPTVTG
jgi:formylmethanofuran dehydrogenase subunit E